MEKIILAEMQVVASCDANIPDFETLVHAHGRFLFNIAFSVLQNPEDAEEVAQEAFFRAFRSGNTARVEHMRSWLGRIAWNLALNRSRSRPRNLQPLQAGDLQRTFPCREISAEELLIRKERVDLLERILFSLPRDLREAFVLMTAHGMTSPNAASILGIAESSVRDRLGRARKLIKEKLRALTERNHDS